MMNLSHFRRRSSAPDTITVALTEATATLAEVGQALAVAQRNHACLIETQIAETRALNEQVQLWRDRADRIDGRLDGFEEWIARMRRAAPRFMGSDLSKALAQFLAAAASHYPPGRDPDAPFRGGRS